MCILYLKINNKINDKCDKGYEKYCENNDDDHTIYKYENYEELLLLAEHEDIIVCQLLNNELILK